MSAHRILVPVPDRDFDVTEVSVPWKLLTEAGHRVVFATERGGSPPSCDPLLLTGVVFGKLGADPEPISFYRLLERAQEFLAPLSWNSIEPADFEGLLLPGGHAPGMKQYLDSESLRGKVRGFWNLNRPVAAICHGVLVAARSGVLSDLRTTCLPKYMERLAYYLTSWRRGRYYRTYPEYVEDEVRASLADPDRQFLRGPITLGARGSRDDDSPAFVVEDGNYLSARWPGDAYLLARRFLALLEG